MPVKTDSEDPPLVGQCQGRAQHDGECGRGGIAGFRRGGWLGAISPYHKERSCRRQDYRQRTEDYFHRQR